LKKEDFEYLLSLSGLTSTSFLRTAMSQIEVMETQKPTVNPTVAAEITDNENGTTTHK
jgi:hypothetical protein